MRIVVIIGLILFSILVYYAITFKIPINSPNQVKDKIEHLEADKEVLVKELEELKATKDTIERDLELALEAIKNLSVPQIKTRIVNRYKRDTIVKEQVKVVIDSTIASNVLLDLEEFDATKLLLYNCQDKTLNLNSQLYNLNQRHKLLQASNADYKKYVKRCGRHINWFRFRCNKNNRDQVLKENL